MSNDNRSSVPWNKGKLVGPKTAAETQGNLGGESPIAVIQESL
jgi:hypothetical protein